MNQVPGFKGIVSDIGGPTANMYKMTCKSDEIETACRKLSCVHPAICDNLVTDHGPLVRLLERVRHHTRDIDEHIRSWAIRLLAETTGVFTETAGGATVAGAVQLAREGKLTFEDEVVICITGNGLKTLDVVEGVLPESPIVEAKVRQVADLVKALG